MDAAAAQAAAEGGTSLLIQVGVGGTFAIVILKTVFDFVSKIMAKRNGNGSNAPTADMFAILRSTADQVKDLHNWHDVKDEDQVFIWYIRRSLEKQIERLCLAVEQMGKATDAQSDAVEEVLTAVLEEMKELRRRLDKQGGTDGG